MPELAVLQGIVGARSERFELPTLGIEISCRAQTFIGSPRHHSPKSLEA